MDWEGSQSRGHLSPHFSWETASVGRQGGGRTGKGADAHHSAATVAWRTWKPTQRCSMSFTKHFLLTLVFTVYVLVSILTFLKSVLKTEGLLSRPTVLLRILLSTAVDLEMHSLFNADSEARFPHALSFCDRNWHEGRKARSGKRLKKLNGGTPWLSDTLSSPLIRSSSCYDSIRPEIQIGKRELL